MKTSSYTDIADFIADRAAWLHITTMTNHHGTVDVVLRIDGSYSPPGYITGVFGDKDLEAAVGGAEEAAEGFRAELEPLLIAMGLGKQMHDWTP